MVKKSDVGAVSRSGRLIIDQIDPAHLVPGGIDTCIHDLVQFAQDEPICLVGVTRTPADVGRWHSIKFAGRRINFFPIAVLDRSNQRGVGKHVPHSARVALGLLRYRRSLSHWDVVQTHRIETGFVTRLLLRPKRRVQFIHNDAGGLTGAQSDSTWRRAGWLYRWIERRTIPSADGVVVFNRTDGPRISKLQRNTVVAQTWFNPEIFGGLPRRSHSNSEGTVRVLFVGRLESQKDPELVIRAFAHLTQIVQEAELTIVGSGSLEPAMRNAAERLGVANNVRFVGAVPRTEVARLMATSSVLLLPSHYEGSPRVIAEANAMGLPVVATPGGDPDRFLESGVNGIRTESRSPVELGTALATAATYNPEACVTSARERSAPTVVHRLLQVGGR
jgi:glycosyltransferase involved in cell wall biosynthesis